MVEENESREFTASRDVVDSLRLEASILSPIQEKQVKSIAQKASDELITLYGKFISERTRKKVKGVKDRILITDTNSFREMYTSWDTITILPTSPDEGTRGTYFVQGRIIVLDDPSKLWNAIFSREVQQRIIKQVGNEEEAKRLAVGITLKDFIIHDIVHQYQNHDLPEAFLECGARYYQRKISQSLHMGYGIDDLTEERIFFYEKLLDQYGNDVHRLFFGGNIDENKKSSIFEKLDREIERLFPKGEGLIGKEPARE